MVSTLQGMTAQTLLHRLFPAAYIIFTAFLGCAAGWLATVTLGFWLASPVENAPAGPPAEQTAVRKRPLSDYQVILDHNIFTATGAASTLLSDSDATPGPLPSATSDKERKASAVLPKDLALVGTIAAGLNSLALLRHGKETSIYRLGDEIADGITVETISRNTVILVFRDGSRQTLTIAEDQSQPSSRADLPSKTVSASANDSAIKQMGENRWVIPQDLADQARGNFNELLKQARMEPRIVAGQTDGFVVRMIRPKSFLGQLGLLQGDVLMEINGVPLNSPEKALQIVQQLRESRNIKVNLLRNDQPLTLEYETE
jgi:general secretion pathway protein C